jgi:AraC-like DNA-binding protein
MYVERPAERVPGIVWRSEDSEPGEVRVLPDGCMDVIWLQGELVVAGPDTVPHLHCSAGGRLAVGLRFLPGRAGAYLGVPADELRDRRVPLRELWPDRIVDDMRSLIGDGVDPGRVIETFVAAHRHDGSVDDRIPGVVRALLHGLDVADAAHAAGISDRQLRRLAPRVFGYGPKTLQRVLRFQRALALLHQGSPIGTAAHAAGYSDQAHLTREVRALAGVTPSALID